MGMSASQARLLSITARLSDNEASAQSVSFAKQRLADETQQINEAYNKALMKTKLSAITGYNDAGAITEDITYDLLTDTRMRTGKQFVITDTKGRVLVENNVAKAFKFASGNINIFLAEMGYSQAANNITISDATDEQKVKIEQDIENAWDKYYASVGLDFPDHEHDYSTDGIIFNYQTNNGYGYPLVLTRENSSSDTHMYEPINFEGTSKEQRELYDYAVALTKSYFVGSSYNTISQTQSSTVTLQSTADDPANKSNINYYKNLFVKMQLSGYYTYSNTGAPDDNTIRVTDLNTTVIKDSALLQEKIKSGELYLEFFSTTEKKFVSTTLGKDDTITEVEDESAIARAEIKYEQDLTALEQRDKKFDLQLKKLDTEHNTLQTEYECIKQIISKNVQNSFKTFNG